MRFDAVPSSLQSPEEAEASAGPFRYAVTKTGYYCVGTVPVTLEGDVEGDGESASAFIGVVDFMNVFEGHLSAGDYPKVAVRVPLAGLLWCSPDGAAFAVLLRPHGGVPRARCWLGIPLLAGGSSLSSSSRR